MARYLKKEPKEPEDTVLADDVVFCVFGGTVQLEAQKRYGVEFCRPCARVLHPRGYVNECVEIDREIQKERQRKRDAVAGRPTKEDGVKITPESSISLPQ